MSVNQRLTNLEKAVHKLEQLANAPRQQDDRSPSDQSHTRQKDNGAEPEPSRPSNIIPAHQHTEAPQQEWYKTFGWRILRFVWSFRFLEGIGIIAVIVYTSLTWLQWRDLRHNFEVDQRAWIKPLYKQPVDDTVSIWQLRMNNIGKSPALRVFLIAVCENIPSQESPSFNRSGFNAGVISEVPLMFQGSDETDVGTISIPCAKGDHFTPGEVDALKGGTAYLAQWGQVIYADQFGPHWTRFCSWRKYSTMPDSAFNARSCVAFNAVGDGTLKAYGQQR